MTDYMESLLPELADYRVASFQQRGVGACRRWPGRSTCPRCATTFLTSWTRWGGQHPVVIGHSWGGHLLLHLMASAPARIGAAIIVDPLGAVGDGGLAAFEAELFRRLPEATVARLTELEAIEATRALTTAEALEAMEIAWPGYFSSLGAAQPIPQRGHAPSKESWASIRAELPALAPQLRGCEVPARFVHGERIRCR